MTTRAVAKSAAQAGAARISESEFVRLAEYARSHWGLSLEPEKRSLIAGRIAPLLERCKVQSITEYLERLNDWPEEAQSLRLLSALTTNFTQFFRESHHIDDMRKRVPTWVETAKRGGRVRLWSAGCSTGQEPYTLAMVILSVFPDAARHDVRILATDIDPQVLSRARAGRYSRAEVSGINPSLIQSFFVPDRNDPEYLVAAPSLSEIISFARLNLVKPLPFNGPFDAVFCRNVSIYFDVPTQEVLWSSLVRVMDEGSVLYIGHSEQLRGPARLHLRHTGPTTYVRNR